MVTRGTEVTTVDYTYDDLNRLETVTDANGTTTYTYYDNGNLFTVTYPNGVVTEYQYNAVNQLENVTTKNEAGETLTSYTYGLDNTGRRESITEADGRFTLYGYDDLYRLTSETITDSTNGDYSASYTHDWVGNRLTETIGSDTTIYVYDDNDRLESKGAIIFAYDDNGNLASETESGTVKVYFYDEKNKLTSIEIDGSELANYAYNHNGIRTSKTESGITTDFIVDQNRDYAQVLQEIQSSTVVVDYTYGLDLISQDLGGVDSYFVYDGLGSTRALTNDAGAVTDIYNYAAFGAPLDILGFTNTSENNYLYTGEQNDSETGDYYLRARYLDPSTGRFTQMDPWMGNDRDPVTLNKYLYANADPAYYVDPTGNFSLGSLSVGMNGTAQLAGRALSSSALRGFVNQAVTATIKQSGKLATQALRSVRSCIRKKNKCGLQANLLIVGQDNPQMAQHISWAQMPHTIVLTYQRNKQANRRWYVNKGGCKITKKPSGSQCDEYPFFKTREGGPRNYPGSVSLKWVPVRENMSVGGHFGFLARKMKDRDQFIVVADRNIPITIALPMKK